MCFNKCNDCDYPCTFAENLRTHKQCLQMQPLQLRMHFCKSHEDSPKISKGFHVFLQMQPLQLRMHFCKKPKQPHYKKSHILVRHCQFPPFVSITYQKKAIKHMPQDKITPVQNRTISAAVLFPWLFIFPTNACCKKY